MCRWDIELCRVAIPSVVVAAAVLAGCDAETAEPADRPASTSPPAPDPLVHTVDEMAREPCRAIGDDVARHHHFSAPTEVDLDIGHSCQWQTPAGALTLTAYPTVDLTRDPTLIQGMTSEKINRRRAYSRIDQDDWSIDVLVAVVPDQSLRVQGAGTDDGNAIDLLSTGTTLASGAAENLR